MFSSKILNSGILVLASLTLMAVPAACAEGYINDHSEYLDRQLASFNRSLDHTAERMRRDYDRSNLAAAHRQLVEAQANQTDTWKTSQDSFNRTQSCMVLSGGAYNSNGSYGLNWGDYKYHYRRSQIAPDLWGSDSCNSR